MFVELFRAQPAIVNREPDRDGKQNEARYRADWNRQPFIKVPVEVHGIFLGQSQRRKGHFFKRLGGRQAVNE